MHHLRDNTCCDQVTWAEFQQFARLRQNVHKLAVALDFYYSTTDRIGRADFQRAVAKILGETLAEDLVSHGFSNSLLASHILAWPLRFYWNPD